jgi:DNA-binding PadR family transcriptional regulator
VSLGPATLYTVLGKFEKEGFIAETEVEGRKRTYRITAEGRRVYREEVERLRTCLADAMDAERGIVRAQTVGEPALVTP